MALTAEQITNLETARGNLVTKYLEISANPKPTYTVGNQSVSWESYLKMLRTEIENIDAMIDAQSSETTFDVVSQGYAP
jgi:hypothetical protein